MNENAADLSHSTVRRWIIAFNAHDVEALVALYAAEGELFDSGMPGPRRGKSQIENWFRWRFRSTPTITYTEQTTSRREEDTFEVTWIASGTGPRVLGLGGKPFQSPGKSVFVLKEEQIWRQQGTYDHLAVIRQIVPILNVLPRGVAEWIYSLYLRRNGVKQ
jgi:hypothetical protein